MSFCRYSDMDFGCDLYVYAEDGGSIAVHVRSYRRIWDPPEPYEDLIRDAAAAPEHEWARRYAAWNAALDAAPVEAVGHPMAGASVRELDPAAALWLCEQLIADGLNAPEWLLTGLREEIARAAEEADAAAG